MARNDSSPNLDPNTVDGFGDEWQRFDQSRLTETELQALFDRYFSIFPWESLPPDAVGFDLGCGSGRWSRLVAPRVSRLLCIDASAPTLDVARRTLGDQPNCELIHASVESMPMEDDSMDFGYSLGVLHHVPDTAAAIESCVTKLKPGAPFLAYIYYAFDNRPRWYRMVWQASDLVRRVISKLPLGARYVVTQAIALLVYLPLARLAWLVERLGISPDNLPLALYRSSSFYTMRTDARDRFGTVLERRFTALEIETMMRAAGLESITFSQSPPFWCAVGFKGRQHSRDQLFS